MSMTKVVYDCNYMFNCCRCGGNDCGCAYCFDCNSCDSCQEYDGNEPNQECENSAD